MNLRDSGSDCIFQGDDGAPGLPGEPGGYGRPGSKGDLKAVQLMLNSHDNISLTDECSHTNT